MGTELPSTKAGQSPHFRPMSIAAKRLDGSRCHLVWRPRPRPGHIVLDGDQLSRPPKGAQPPIFVPHLLWQTAGWIKMPLGMEVGLGPGHIVLDGDPAPSTLPKGGGAHHPQIFGPCLLWPLARTAGWIKMPLNTKVGLVPGHNVLHGDLAHPQRGTAPIFGRCLLWRNGRPSQLLLSTCFQILIDWKYDLIVKQ